MPLERRLDANDLRLLEDADGMHRMGVGRGSTSIRSERRSSAAQSARGELPHRVIALSEHTEHRHHPRHGTFLQRLCRAWSVR